MQGCGFAATVPQTTKGDLMSHRKAPTRPVTSRLALALVAAAALAGAGVGCGSGDDEDEATLTKAEVISQGGAICQEAEQSVEDLPAIPSDRPFVEFAPKQQQLAREFLVGYADLLDSTREGLAQLDAPEEDRELLDGYIADVEAVVAELRAASEAEPDSVEAKADKAFALFDRASEHTAAYGFPKGVCGSGNSS
jgi:hypothetical protein